MRGSLGGRLCCLKRRLHPRERTLLRVLSLIKGHLRGPSCPRWGRVNATSDRWDESWFSFQEGPAEEGGEYHPQTTITGAILAQAGPALPSAGSSGLAFLSSRDRGSEPGLSRGVSP